MRRWRTPTPATAPPSTSRYSITCGNATTPRSAPGHPQPAAGLARREPPGYSLGCWLREYKEQVFLFTRVFAVSWTNNVSERGAKAAKRHQAVSGYWHSLATLARWCRLRSYLDTSAAHGITALDAISAAIAGKPWPPPLPAIALHQFTAPREWTPANAQITARRPTGIVGWWLNSDHVVGCPDWNILLVRRARGGGCWSLSGVGGVCCRWPGHSGIANSTTVFCASAIRSSPCMSSSREPARSTLISVSRGGGRVSVISAGSPISAARRPAV